MGMGLHATGQNALIAVISVLMSFGLRDVADQFTHFFIAGVIMSMFSQITCQISVCIKAGIIVLMLGLRADE